MEIIFPNFRGENSKNIWVANHHPGRVLISIQTFHRTPCQGSMKDVISAAQSGGDSKSPMQSPVIATTLGKLKPPNGWIGNAKRKQNPQLPFLYTSYN